MGSITEQDVWRSNSAGTAFYSVGSAIELKRRSATALSFSGSIFVFGGFCDYVSLYCIRTDAGVLASKDGKLWSKVVLTGYNWAQVSAGMFGGATAGGSMYLFDGFFTFKVSGDASSLNRVKLAPIDIPRSSSAFLSVYNSLWIISGLTSSNQYQTDVYVSFDFGITWNSTSELRDNGGNQLTSFARSESASVLFENQVCVMGGFVVGSYTNTIFCSLPQIYPAPIFSIISSPQVLVGSQVIIQLWALIDISTIYMPGIPSIESISCTISVDGKILNVFNYTSPFNLSIVSTQSVTDVYTITAVPNLNAASMFVFDSQLSIARVSYLLRNRLPAPKFDAAAGQVAKNTIQITCILGNVKVLAPASAASNIIVDISPLASVQIKLISGILITVTAECYLNDWLTSPQMSSQFYYYQLPTQPAIQQQNTVQATTSTRTKNPSTFAAVQSTTLSCFPPVVQSVKLASCCSSMDCSCNADTTGGDSLILQIAGLIGVDSVQIGANATPCPLTAVTIKNGANNRECKNLLCLESTRTCSCQLPGGVGTGTVFWMPLPSVDASLQSWIFFYSMPILSRLVFDAGSTSMGGQINIFGNNFGVSLNSEQPCPCLYQNLGIMSQLLIGDTAGSAITWISDSAITASVAPGVGSKLMVSLTLQGQSATQSTYTFSYEAPKITGLSSLLGPFEGGLELTVYGSSFGAKSSTASEVSFLDSIASINYSRSLSQYFFSSQTNSTGSGLIWISDSSIACITPAGYGVNRRIGTKIAQQLAISDPLFSFVEWSSPVLITCNISAEILQHSDTGENKNSQSLLDVFLSWLRVILNLQKPDQIYLAGIVDTGIVSLSRKSLDKFAFPMTTIELRFLEVPDGNSPNIQQILNRLGNIASIGHFNMSIIPVIGLQIGNSYIPIQASYNATQKSSSSVGVNNITSFVIPLVCSLMGLFVVVAIWWRYGKCKASYGSRGFNTSARVASSLVWFRGMHVNDDGNAREDALHSDHEIRPSRVPGDLDDSDLCCICLDAKREAIIVHDDLTRSRHKALCIGCAYKIADSTATCPLCRLPILAVLHDPSSGV